MKANGHFSLLLWGPLSRLLMASIEMLLINRVTFCLFSSWSPFGGFFVPWGFRGNHIFSWISDHLAIKFCLFGIEKGSWDDVEKMGKFPSLFRGGGKTFSPLAMLKHTKINNLRIFCIIALYGRKSATGMRKNFHDAAWNDYDQTIRKLFVRLLAKNRKWRKMPIKELNLLQ